MTLARKLALRLARTLPRLVDADALESDAMLALVQAARTFAPDRGASFATYACVRIRGAMLDALRERQHLRQTEIPLIFVSLDKPIVVLFREACATHVPELARAEVGTLRQKVFKVAARVETSVRRIWFHFSASWPFAELFRRIVAALTDQARRLRAACFCSSNRPRLRPAVSLSTAAADGTR